MLQDSQKNNKCFCLRTIYHRDFIFYMMIGLGENMVKDQRQKGHFCKKNVKRLSPNILRTYAHIFFIFHMLIGQEHDPY